jgi:hypothetical protein
VAKDLELRTSNTLGVSRRGGRKITEAAGSQSQSEPSVRQDACQWILHFGEKALRKKSSVEVAKLPKSLGAEADLVV